MKICMEYSFFFIEIIRIDGEIFFGSKKKKKNILVSRISSF